MNWSSTVADLELLLKMHKQQGFMNQDYDNRENVSKDVLGNAKMDISILRLIDQLETLVQQQEVW
jgi:hypothetical protein